MEKLYTMIEVADYLKVTKQSVHNYIESGDLIALKVGGNVRIRETDLKEFIEKRKK